MEVQIRFQTSCISSSQGRALAESLSKAINALTREPSSRVCNLEIISDEEKQELWTMNRAVPTTVERCVHDLFSEQADAQPKAPAICAWDGEMTYSELDRLSTRLAGQLIRLGVEPEHFVPLCFEKSMWQLSLC